ncbi:MAG: hypothetical protein QNJ16_05825 [Rhodobacter sp.]|nr:hypothetical protein [Rhodobacter sp.]
MKHAKNRAALFVSTAVAVGLLGASYAAAQPKPNVFDGGNRWEITYFNDPASDHTQWATQIICFMPYAPLGTGITGAWYSLSFPDWNGRYYQEGDEVKMTGDYARDVGHDHMTLYHTTFDNPDERRGGMAFKDWTEWREDGSFGRIIGWGNARLVRVGRCPFEEVEGREAMEVMEALSLKVAPRLRLDGKEAESPGEEGQESLEQYQERTGLRFEQ